MGRRVLPLYNDGQYSLIEDENDAFLESVEIPTWQWWLYCVYRSASWKVYRWIMTLDNAVYEARKAREEEEQ